ncbi:CDP-diacylglycerol--glycerol-3-phosphate 3-phosphatidyltransferase [Teredinibacter haidensis]|uniref:CDP-diacylglycerol--glycerol-3-phosphate 3-phosphatidyltransferase n=1 Tax=Teredinibacter haidensis TaxID=2731755 RepID=UPI000A6CC1BF|nr:CDP-diacylglycerol--glycerol-3-phosphate 3-phosphatidyltransferase [Teredinibacter haidensis]
MKPDTDSVKFQSLNMVRDELVATIDESARNLEQFVTQQEDSDALQSCINGIRQIVGILRLIQFGGASLLAEELLITATDISPGNSGSHFDKQLEVISNTFFVLTRYLEYIQQVERNIPVLLIPQINELRKLRSEPALSECHFFHIDLGQSPAIPAFEPFPLNGTSFTQMVKRLRQMYQIGLLGLMREQQIKNSLAMMRRAMIRMQRISGHSQPLTLLWWLANLSLEAMHTEGMAILETRKILFSRIDRVLRQIQVNGEAALKAAPPRALLKELVYLLALSGKASSEITAIRESYGILGFSLNDKDLTNERDALNGPSAHTVMSLANVLQSELEGTKRVLENAAQSSSQKIDDIDEFIANLQKIAEILSVVGLVSPSNILREEIKRIQLWKLDPDAPDNSELADVANTLLYLESAVAALESAKLSDEKLAEANKIAQQEIIASSELSEAGRIVVEECEAGLSLTKRALSSFVDSNYDIGHIRNIAKTLNTVRGGMIMLKRDHAADVLARCVSFVEDVLMDQEQPAALKELLETFADAIVSIEYYLDSATSSLQMDESVLKIADESLEALGHAVYGES